MKAPFGLLALCSLLATASLAAEKPCRPVARAVDERFCAEQVGTHPRELLALMWVPLFEEYARRQEIQPTQEEIRSMSARFAELREPGMEPDEREANFIRKLVLSWKVGGDLHRQHGGRVLLSSFGFHMPIEAVEAFLKDEQKRGTFEIYDEGLRKVFWQEIRTGMQGDGVVGEEEARRIYGTPPWEARPEATPASSPWRGGEQELKRLEERVRGALEGEGRKADFERLTILPARRDDLLVGRVIHETAEEIVVDIELCGSSNVFYHLRKPYLKERAGSHRCGGQEYELFAVRQN